MRQFLFIQLKYDTICWRKTRNFNSSPRLFHVQGTSLARQITANSWVNLFCFMCHAKLTATYLCYIKVKVTDINKFISFKYFVLCVIILRQKFRRTKQYSFLSKCHENCNQYGQVWCDYLLKESVTFSLTHNFDIISSIANGMTLYKQKKNKS